MKNVTFILTIFIELLLVMLLCNQFQFFWVDAFFAIGVFTFSVLLMFLLNIKAKTGNYTAYQRARNGYEISVENRWPINNPIMLAAGLFCLLSLLVSGVFYLSYF